MKSPHEIAETLYDLANLFGGMSTVESLVQSDKPTLLAYRNILGEAQADLSSTLTAVGRLRLELESRLMLTLMDGEPPRD